MALTPGSSSATTTVEARDGEEARKEGCDALAATGAHVEARDARARAAWWRAAFDAARTSSAR